MDIIVLRKVYTGIYNVYNSVCWLVYILCYSVSQYTSCMKGVNKASYSASQWEMACHSTSQWKMAIFKDILHYTGLNWAIL